MPLHNALRKKEEKRKEKRITRRIKEGITKRDSLHVQSSKQQQFKIGNILYAMILFYFIFNFLTLCYWLASEEVFSIK
jgi:hypothetical protein